MAPTRHREKEKQRLSVPSRRTSKVASRSEENINVKTSCRSREPRRQSSLPPNPNTSSSSGQRQRVRTISVPAGLKEILNDLSKEPSNIALYCAQVLEGRLEERRKAEEDVLRKEEEELRLAEEKQRKVELAKEDFRKRSKNVTAKRNCESQTGFTTDSDSGFESQCIERGKRFQRTTRTTNTCTEEDLSMDSETNSPKEPKKQPEKVMAVEEPKVPEKTEVIEEKKTVARLPRSRLVSVSEPLDRAMQQLEESLEDGENGAAPASSSLLVPTSDLEEEWRSESEEELQHSDQLLCIRLDVEDEVRLVHLQVSKQGVKVVSDLGSVTALSQTTVPIVFCSQSRYGEKKAPADLALTDVTPLVRSLSPVVFTPGQTEVSLKRSAAELKRQLTFVETPGEAGETEKSEGGSQTDRVEVREGQSQTEGESRSEVECQTEEKEREDVQAGTQTIPVAMSQAGVQTEPEPAREELIPQTFPPTRSPRYELTFSSTQTSPVTSTNMISQTTPVTSNHMTSQTSPQTSSRTRESSPVSCRVATTNTGVSEAAADEMVARVLLEHAGAESDTRQSLSTSSSSASSSSSTISEASGSLFSVESGRATSYDNVTNRQAGKDLSRTVNYLDLSRLGNEGETPNSDEIWVTVEDDNKFLTSDTETYSVATDKVSTMALFKGHAVGSGFAENVGLLNSASEAELAELGNESLASDLDGPDFSLANFGSLLHNEIEPIRSRLDSTGKTVTGIAETLYHIQDGINNLCCNVTQMKSKVLSSFESENSLFVAASQGQSEAQAEMEGEIRTEDKLELVKDGVPVGEPEHLVERMVTKLDSALRRRDENMKNVMLSLEEDNRQLRQELELYRRRETGASEQSQVLESKIQEVLDSMERLGKKKSPRSEQEDRELPPLADGKLPSKFKRRSKSRPKDRESCSSSDSKAKVKPRRQNAYENDTSSSEPENRERQKSKSALKVDKLEVLVTNTKTENVALKQDLVEQKEKEAELVKRNLELEAELVKALTPVSEVVQECKEVQTSARRRSSTVSSTVGVNTDLPLPPPPPPPLTVQSPSSSSPSKSDSPVKDEVSLKAKTQVRKSRTRIKTKKVGGVSSSTMEEVTEVGQVQGRGHGVDGGTPSPSPSREKEKPVKTEPAAPSKANGKAPPGNGKQRSVSRPNGKKASSVPPKPSESKVAAGKKETTGNGKKSITIEEPKKAKSGKTDTVSDNKKSKVIEGDDFRVTITSNADLVSCELSDTEDPGSPRKKIIVTPKTPDGKKVEQKKQQQEAAVTKKGGKIPIRETYIKQKVELPAPQQFPAARPSREQLPAPVAHNYSGSCAASPNFASPLAMTINQPMTVNYVGYNTYIPPTPASDQVLLCSPSDRSLASTNLPISGRNTGMSYDGEVFTMMIKQESRDSNVYDAPSCIPDIYMRESPDGAYSYVIDGPALSSMSNISDIKHDCEEESSDGLERDIIRDFVMMEDGKDQFIGNTKKAGKGGSPFKGYAEKVKQKVIKEFVNQDLEPAGPNKKKNKVDFQSDRPPTRVLPVRKTAKKRLLKNRSQSLSMDQLHELGESTTTSTRQAPDRLSRSRNTYYSTERLPTLTATEEERIIRIKKYEDDTEKMNEKKAAALRVKEAKEKYKFRKQKSFHQEPQITIYETAARPWTVPEDLAVAEPENGEINGNLQQPEVPEPVSSLEEDQNNNNGINQKRRKLRKWRGLSPMTRTGGKVTGLTQLPLSVECFIVSRGWQIDQAQLNKAIARLDGINFVRIQMANTINRVVENIRPHNDVVLIHIGTNELSEACHSITSEDSVPGLAGSMASVFSRHIITACRTFRETKLVVSMPIPRNTEKLEADNCDSLEFYDSLRKAFTNCLRANFIDYDNVIICSNDNLGNDSGQPDTKFYSDSVNLNNAGMKKLTKNWEAIIHRMKRISDGVVHYRRSSESSSLSSSASGSSSSGSSASSLLHRIPWKPY